MTKLPQVLTNVPVADRDALASAAAVWEAVEAESAELEGGGRVLVRPSGTEPVVRVMVEAPTRGASARRSAGGVAAVVERELGPRRRGLRTRVNRVVQALKYPQNAGFSQ